MQKRVAFVEMVFATVSAEIGQLITRIGEIFRSSYHISNSGPVRKDAPESLASRMDSKMRSRFPSKSNAHWLSVAQAIVTFRPISVGIFRGCGPNWKVTKGFVCSITRYGDGDKAIGKMY